MAIIAITTSAATLATLANQGGNVYNLSYPVDLTINTTITTGVTATIRVQGTIVSQGTISPVPEPTLVLTLCFSACGAVGVWRRRTLARGTTALTSNCACS
jgi:hypothetical protein